jgi:hypothetical protein
VPAQKDAILHASEKEWGYWNKKSDADNLRFMNEWERGLTPADPKQAGMMRRYKRMLDVNYTLDHASGLDYAYVQDYLSHIWEKPDDWQAFAEAKTAQVGPTWFQKKRVYEFIQDGLAAGLKLKYRNVVDLLVHRLMSSVDARQRVGLLYDLQRMQLAYPAKQGGQHLGRRGWRAINAPDRQQWMLAPDVQPLWKNAVEAQGMWQAQGLGGGMFRGWMALKNVWVPMKLAASAFHPLHVLHINYSDGMARAFDDVVKGKDPVEALKSLYHGFIDPMVAAPGASVGTAIGAVAGTATGIGPYFGGMGGAIAGAAIHGGLRRLGVPVDLPHAGKQGRAAWMTTAGARTPEQRAQVKLMTEGGFVPQLSPEMKIKAERQLKIAWQKVMRGEAGVSDWRKLISAGLRRPMEVLQAPIFEQWIPSVKTAAYLHEAAALLRRNPDLLTNDNDRKQALRGIAQQIDGRYGEKFYGTMFWNRYMKDSAIASFLSLGWNYGFLHQFGGAAMEAVTRPAGILPPFKPSGPRRARRMATNKLQFAIAYLASAALINGLMTALYTGEDPHGLDWIFARIGGDNPDGSPRRITNMFYLREWPMLQKHIQEAGGVISGASEMLGNKLMFEPFKELLNNRDYYGFNIWDENAPWYQQTWQALKHTFSEQTSPMGVSGAEHAAELSGKPFRWNDPSTWKDSLTAKGVGESVAGFGPAPAYVEKTPIQNRISRLYQDHVAPASSPEEKGENFRNKMAVRTEIMVARQNKDQAAEQAARAEGLKIGLTPKYMNAIGKEPTDVYLFSRLPAADQVAIMRRADPDEYKRYWPKVSKEAKPRVLQEYQARTSQ